MLSRRDVVELVEELFGARVCASRSRRIQAPARARTREQLLVGIFQCRRGAKDRVERVSSSKRLGTPGRELPVSGIGRERRFIGNQLTDKLARVHVA